jgi:hypothetical protein
VARGADEAAVVGDVALVRVDDLNLENGGTFRSFSPSELERKDDEPNEPRENSGGG